MALPPEGPDLGARSADEAAERLARPRIAEIGRGLISQSGPLLGLLLLSAVIAVLEPTFLTFNNLGNVGQQIAVISIVALGGTLVIISGGIDLSVGSIVALASVVFGLTFTAFGVPWPLAMVAAVATATAVGVLNGLLITVGRLPAFIATLATLSMARGMALVLSEGRPISGFPDTFRFLTSGRLPGGIPVSVGLTVVVFVLGALMLRHTVFGRATYAIGGNEEVARLSGIRILSLKVRIYALAGMLAGIGGLVLTSRLNSAQPVAAQGLELDVIAAVVIGGASLSGGQGTAFGTLLGALIIGVLRNGLNLLNVSSFWQQVAVGAVIAGAVMTDTLRRRGR
jgi:ribose transport system permease protein